MFKNEQKQEEKQVLLLQQIIMKQKYLITPSYGRQNNKKETNSVLM
jgi:hypothetical protein